MPPHIPSTACKPKLIIDLFELPPNSLKILALVSHMLTPFHAGSELDYTITSFNEGFFEELVDLGLQPLL